MAVTSVNGVRLFYEITGVGAIPLVFVHGSWTSHRSWDAIVPPLSASFRIITYDRRGHSDSERPDGQGSVREDVADLAALIEALGLARAFVLGNSFGAAIALRLAATGSALVHGLIIHEPPLMGLLGGDPAFAPMLEEIGRWVGAVGQRIVAGDHAGAAEQFAETVALGPGSWAQLDPENQQTMIGNASTFLDELNDPEALQFDLDAIGNFDRPALLTVGTQSPPMFGPIMRKIAGALPRAQVTAIDGAGHIPQITHPEEYARLVAAFVQKQAIV